ncbi:D-hexose-6-phosphate mutarotase [Streptomyces sp. NPDC048606]|uniref:D-hexose-6-phosphate mutarotase n=1 Tax=Streptomyces sp. NPDC048606 TaxID=3154726 RepID=UPI00343488BD
MSDELSAFFSLAVTERLSDSVTLRRIGEIPVVVVDHPRVRGVVSLQGGQLIAWQPTGSAPGLWLGERAGWQAGKPIRGGVPLCWPWFGPAASPSLPSHGFARNLLWELVEHDSDEDSVLLTLRLRDSEATLALWPHEFTLDTRIRLGAACDVEIEAHGEFVATAALHTYLPIGDLGTAEVTGLGAPYRDNLLAEDVVDAGGAVTPEGHVERVYTRPEKTTVIDDRTLGRAIEVTHDQAGDVVVWNPGPELSASMADLTDEDYRHFLCVETARINTPIEATAGRPGRLALTLRLLPDA